MTSTRSELLCRLNERCENAPGLRFGQLVANLATLALGTKPEAIWDAEDDELLSAANRLMAHYCPEGTSAA
jgi:hypothetical protein